MMAVSMGDVTLGRIQAARSLLASAKWDLPEVESVTEEDGMAVGRTADGRAVFFMGLEQYREIKAATHD